jgi:hypothetical protein
VNTTHAALALSITAFAGVAAAGTPAIGVIADVSSALPGGPYHEFSDPIIRDGVVYFVATRFEDPSSPDIVVEAAGLFRWDDGVAEPIFRTGDPVEGSALEFSPYPYFDADGGVVAVVARDLSTAERALLRVDPDGVARYAVEPGEIATDGVDVTKFIGLNPLGLDDGDLYFVSGDARSLYRKADGQIAPLLTRGDPIPGAPADVVNSVSLKAMRDGSLLISVGQSGTTRRDLVAYRHGQFELLQRSDADLGDGYGPVRYFGTAAAAGADRYAFVARGANFVDDPIAGGPFGGPNGVHEVATFFDGQPDEGLIANVTIASVSVDGPWLLSTPDIWSDSSSRLIGRTTLRLTRTDRGLAANLVTEDDTLVNGMVIDRIHLSSEAIEGDRGVFRVRSDDGAEAVCVVDLSGVFCPADFAEPIGTQDFFDINAFLAAFNAGEPAADLAEPFGVFDFFDVSAFLGAFQTPCP